MAVKYLSRVREYISGEICLTRFLPQRRRRRSASSLASSGINMISSSSAAASDGELEHGKVDPHTNVTNDDPLITGKIALAHLNEFPDYYTRLDKMEKEADEFSAQTFTFCRIVQLPHAICMGGYARVRACATGDD